MNEAVFRRDAYSMLRKMGYWPIRGRDATVCPKCHTKILPPIGRPDVLILAPHGINRVLETKCVAKDDVSFSFAEITSDQRDWLNNWMMDGGLGYIGIGIARRPSSFYIIDWGAWLNIEDAVRPYQNSIPVDLGIGRHLKVLRNEGLDLKTRAMLYRMERRDGDWWPQSGHTLLKWQEINYVDTE